MLWFLNQLFKKKEVRLRAERERRIREAELRYLEEEKRRTAAFYAALAEYQATHGAIARRCPIPPRTLHWVN